MSTHRTPATESKRLNLTVVTLASLIVFVIGLAFGAGVAWTSLQDRLDRMDKHLQYDDSRLDALKK